MKKILSVILTIFMMFSIGTMMVSCKDNENSTSQTQEMTDEEKVRKTVDTYAQAQYNLTTIGGNEIKSSMATITYLKWSADKTKCTVSGIMYMTDIYSTVWKNNFDCVVTYSESDECWQPHKFNYKSTSWSKN